jgi:dihydrofolate synthase/folylpolyglutamate synthase
MDNLYYLLEKSSSNSNKNLEILGQFFTKDERKILSKKSVSIVGTNGKTTTATVLNEILFRSGLRTTLFTSPHLVTLNERIQVKQDKIVDTDLDKGMQKIRNFEETNNIVLGYFESIFLIAAKHFLEENLDIFIAEAGIGGRLDTTSILNSKTVCLTNISLDHTELLGSTIQEILTEKIHVSKNVKNFINGSKEIHNEYESTIKDSLQITDGNYFLGFQVDKSQNLININKNNFLKSNQNIAIKTSKVIIHNLAKIEQLKETSELLDSIHLIIPKGRFQVIQQPPNLKVIDGAHNASGVEAFFNLLEETYNIDKINNLDCYIGFNKNKDFISMLKTICLKKYLNIRVLEDNCFFKQLTSATLEQFLISNKINYKISTLEEFHLSKKPSILLGSLYLIGEYIKEYK